MNTIFKNQKLLLGIACFFSFYLSACKKETPDDVDTSYPEIKIGAVGSFPQQCSEIKRGEKFVYRIQFTDNRELGSSSVDIHHNFDHHTHSSEIVACDLEPKKMAVNPFLLIRTYAIPAGLQSYEMEQEISVPADVDPGDYHFSIRLTDKAGWQTIKGISIKVI